VILPPARRDVVANVSDHVRLPCDVRTDPAERRHLTVEWHRDGVVIDPARDRHITVDSTDHSLHLTGALVTDTADYTCHADNGLDQASSEPTSVLIRGELALMLQCCVRLSLSLSLSNVMYCG